MKNDNQEFKPDVYGYAPTNAPLIMVMGSQTDEVKNGLIVYARHGGKLGLTHMDRLFKAEADCVPDLMSACEKAEYCLNFANEDIVSAEDKQRTLTALRAAIKKAKGNA